MNVGEAAFGCAIGEEGGVGRARNGWVVEGIVESSALDPPWPLRKEGKGLGGVGGAQGETGGSSKGKWSRTHSTPPGPPFVRGGWGIQGGQKRGWSRGGELRRRTWSGLRL